MRRSRSVARAVQLRRGLPAETVEASGQLDDAAIAQSTARILPLDLAKEKARYGGQTRGGLGISVPLGVTV